jgi:hypothetical protein
MNEPGFRCVTPAAMYNLNKILQTLQRFARNALLRYYMPVLDRLKLLE